MIEKNQAIHSPHNLFAKILLFLLLCTYFLFSDAALQASQEQSISEEFQRSQESADNKWHFLTEKSLAKRPKEKWTPSLNGCVNSLNSQKNTWLKANSKGGIVNVQGWHYVRNVVEPSRMAPELLSCITAEKEVKGTITEKDDKKIAIKGMLRGITEKKTKEKHHKLRNLERAHKDKQEKESKEFSMKEKALGGRAGATANSNPRIRKGDSYYNYASAQTSPDGSEKYSAQISATQSADRSYTRVQSTKKYSRDFHSKYERHVKSLTKQKRDEENEKITVEQKTNFVKSAKQAVLEINTYQKEIVNDDKTINNFVKNIPKMKEEWNEAFTSESEEAEAESPKLFHKKMLEIQDEDREEIKQEEITAEKVDKRKKKQAQQAKELKHKETVGAEKVEKWCYKREAKYGKKNDRMRQETENGHTFAGCSDRHAQGILQSLPDDPTDEKEEQQKDAVLEEQLDSLAPTNAPTPSPPTPYPSPYPTPLPTPYPTPAPTPSADEWVGLLGEQLDGLATAGNHKSNTVENFNRKVDNFNHKSNTMESKAKKVAKLRKLEQLEKLSKTRSELQTKNNAKIEAESRLKKIAQLRSLESKLHGSMNHKWHGRRRRRARKIGIETSSFGVDPFG